jgi:hypothetical protein
MSKAIKLKPCPWCNVVPEVVSLPGCWTVECPNLDCPVSPSTIKYRRRREAMAAWNRRKA